MADQNVTAEEVLLDVKIADASKLNKFFLHEKKILGALARVINVIVFVSNRRSRNNGK